MSKNIIHSVIKLGEVGSHTASMHQKVSDTCRGDSQAISNAKAEIAELNKTSRLKLRILRSRQTAKFNDFGKNLIWPGVRISGYGKSFASLITRFKVRDLRNKMTGFNKPREFKMNPWLKFGTFNRH